MSSISVSLGDSVCSVKVGEQLVAQCSVEHLADSIVLYWPSAVIGAKTDEERMVLSVVEHAFTRLEGVTTIEVATRSDVAEPLLERAYFEARGDRLSVERKAFFQIPLLWHRNAAYKIAPERWTATGGVSHPKRPVTKPGVIYSRFIPSIQRRLSFELLDVERHLDDFHDWQNQKRVSQFWELDKTKADLREYLSRVHADPHHIPVIASLDGEPSGYFEIYWTPEDRLGPYYESQAFDRGFHFLIGNKEHLGRKSFNAFVESITHFLFLDDARTRTILAEPRADNIALLHYLSKFPYWEKRYEFDFPHKRAALLASRREDFFDKASFR